MNQDQQARDINTWPYSGVDGMTQKFQRKDFSWVETNEENFFQQMRVLPPYKMSNDGFVAGEAWSGWNHAVFMNIDGRFFCKITDVRKYNGVTYREEIIKQFNMGDK